MLSQTVHVPPEPVIRLRPILPEDRAPLYAIHRAAMRPYVEATWGWDDDVQAGFWERTAHDGVQVVEREGALIGYVDVQTRDDHVEIVNIVLGPDSQGRGIGNWIIWKVIEDARNGGLDVRLQVLKVNTRAKELYERLGFTTTGETSTHVQMVWQVSR